MNDAINWLPASFRGIPFVVEDHKQRGGRRGPTHQWAGRDDSAFEDMGGKTGQFTITGYVIGNDQHEQAKRLRDALDAKGDGTLVHPRLGQITVSCPSWESTESIRERRMTRFTMTFDRSGEVANPSTSIDTSVAVRRQRGEAQDATVQDFGRMFDVSNQPNFVQDAGRNLVTDLLEAIDRGTGQASRLLSLSDLNSLMGQPMSLGSRLLGLLSFRPTNPLSQFSTTSWRRPVDQGITWTSYGSQYSAVPETTSSRRQQAANQAAIINLVQRGGLLDLSSASADATPPTRQDAVQLRYDVTAAYDQVLPNTGDDVYRPMKALHAATVQDITTRSASSAELTSYQLDGPVPALVLAHRLYGDEPDGGASRELQILQRNPKIRHPGAVPPGAIEMVADA